MSTPLRVLILEDRPADAELMLYELREAGFEPAWERVETEADYVARLGPALDVILADYTLPQFNALQALRLLQERGLDIPFIVVTGSVSEEAAVECMKQGAADYLLKDRLARLGPAVAHALQEKKLRDERRQIDQALRESEERFRSAFDFAAIGMSLVAPDGRFLEVNRSLCELLGYSEQELLNRSFQDLTHPDDLDANLRGARQLLAGEIRSYQTEKRYIHKDGHTIWAFLSTALLRDPQGNPLYFVSQVQDITERKRAEAERARLIAILEATTDFVATADAQGRRLYLNRSGRRMIGFGEDEDISGFPIAEGHPQWARELVLNEGFPTAIRGGVWQGETALLSRDGREIPVSQVIIAHKAPDGSVELFSTIARDITERRQAEEALEHERNLLRTLIDNLPDYIYVKDIESRFVIGNVAVARLMGATAPDELLGKTDFDFYPQEMASQYYADEQEIIRSGQPLVNREEPSADQVTGRKGWLLTTKVPLRDRLGNVVGIVGIGRDITERKRAEEAEREQRALAEALRDTAAALTSTLSFDEVLDRILAEVGRVAPHDAANIMLIESGVARVARSRGYAERGIEPAMLALRFPVTELSSLRYMVETGRPLAIPDTQTYPGWVDMPAARWVRSYAAAPIRVKEQVIGFLNLDSATPNFFTQTHAERLQAFADQAAIAIENARLHTSLQETNVQLRLALRAKDEMIQNVSHELRTPLAIIMGYVELLKQGAFDPLTAEQKHIVATLDKQSERLHFMVHRLLTLQMLRPEALQKIQMELGPWLRGIVPSWVDRAAAAGVTLRLEVSPELPLLMVDADLLEQVVVNLLDNAIKFSPGGGVVTVRAYATTDDRRPTMDGRPEAAVVIAVADQGIGIPPDKLEMVFERFYQVDASTTRRFGGMGIGLALCKAIVEAHGGRIWAESKGEGHGSTFCAALPVM